MPHIMSDAEEKMSSAWQTETDDTCVMWQQNECISYFCTCKTWTWKRHYYSCHVWLSLCYEMPSQQSKGGKTKNVRNCHCLINGKFHDKWKYFCHNLCVATLCAESKFKVWIVYVISSDWYYTFTFKHIERLCVVALDSKVVHVEKSHS